MATKKIDPEKLYKVQLRRVVEVAPQVFARPSDDLTLKGKVLETILESVLKYEEA